MSSGSSRAGAGLVFHDGLHDEVDRVHVLERAGRHGQLDAVEAGLAVDGGGDFLRTDERAVVAGVHRDVGAVCLLERERGETIIVARTTRTPAPPPAVVPARAQKEGRTCLRISAHSNTITGSFQ